MINKLIAIAAIVVAPSLASAQSTGSNGGTGGNGTAGQPTSSTSSPSSGGSAASNPPRTEQQRRHDSLVTQMRNQRADTGNVQQFNGALSSDTTDTTGRDTTRSDTSMMNRSDSTMMDSMRTDTTRFHTDTTDTSTYRDTTEEHGELYTPPRGALAARNMGLKSDQAKELQKAINDAGCHAGPVDGVIGPKTREGITCVREQKGIQGEGLDGVLSALGLSFTPSPNATEQSPRSGSRFRPHNGVNPESTMSRPDTSTAASSYQSDTTTTPTMDTTRSTDSSMVTDTSRSMDTTSTMDTTSVMDSTTAPDTTTPRDTSSAYPSTTPTDSTTTTNPVDTTMNPMNPMHQTDTTLTRPDTSAMRGRN
jgi:hypothetical protein